MQVILNNLTKGFQNKAIFENFGYTFESPGIYAIIGDSGVGKTTLLRMIAGLDNKYSGEILGGGIKNTSFAFQEYRLFPTITALENAVIANGELTDGALKQRAIDLLFRLGFSENDLALLPSELSGGMKQRVSLVRAFLRDTPILLLDEPTKELDETIRKSLYDIIKEESKKRLVIMVSHQNDDFEELSAQKVYI